MRRERLSPPLLSSLSSAPFGAIDDGKFAIPAAQNISNTLNLNIFLQSLQSEIQVAQIST
jgi:hypothetical protein